MVFVPLTPCQCTLCNQNIPTVTAFANFNAEADAKALKAAMKGWGCNNEEITKILGNRTANQRHEISETYKSLYGEDLNADLKSELGGNFERLVLALMCPWPQFCASVLKRAFKGLGTDEGALIDILCTANNCEINLIKAAYKELDGDELEDDLKSEVSGVFGNLMVAVLQAARLEEAPVNPGQAMADAQKLFEAGELQLGTDESIFTAILVRNSYAQLVAVDEAYKSISEKTLEEALESELSGDILDAAKTILGVAKNKYEFFAKRINATMAGFGTDDKDLINIIVLRSEIDLGNIMLEFEKLYGRTLAAAIEDETSGDYKKLLLDILY